ncbi:NRAMP family divalent metal transporter [Desulfotalea psychrophila]|uniref:Related to Mn2+ and Fe2+ transporters of the NRAMP family n=1 Tax=Desulfotalea psychrophila (strain LSv54 / DSM 12343) TaxID=177439 RepID=Q6AKY6_DESPS|nr:divalent metal cation transporter [Desulfotalea psychrophila]CAG36989.1 related to Mn2+ and Fe2+ transporters of the NRAMP family [Desulfotalea psychrophila LSv54]
MQNEVSTAQQEAGSLPKRYCRYIKNMGPAWIISAVACGPATLASVAIAGATYGYKMLWVVILSAVFGTTTQYLAARVGVLEGMGIIAATEKHLGKRWAWILTIDALLATWLAAMVLMNALAGVTSLITGVDTPYWGVLYGVLVALFLVRRGYRNFETLCKVLVIFVVACFMATLFMADLSLPAIGEGLLPNFPGGIDAALMMAAIMGGAVHITIIGMHTYNTNARGWKIKDLSLARFDTFSSMGMAFGLYSVAIFLVDVAVLHPNGIAVKRATDAALALKPLLGDSAMKIFMVGLWAATLSTLSPTFMAGAYFLSDKMGWQLDVKDRRFAGVVFAGCLLSMLGPFVKGSFFLLLPLMLALGLTGTPLIIAIILYLLNRRTGSLRNSALLNLMGGLTFLVTSFLAVRFLLAKFGIM